MIHIDQLTDSPHQSAFGFINTNTHDWCGFFITDQEDASDAPVGAVLLETIHA